MDEMENDRMLKEIIAIILNPSLHMYVARAFLIEIVERLKRIKSKVYFFSYVVLDHRTSILRRYLCFYNYLLFPDMQDKILNTSVHLSARTINLRDIIDCSHVGGIIDRGCGK